MSWPNMEEEEDDHEELIKRTQEVLQHHRGEASVQRSGNKGEALCHRSRHIHPKN